MHRNAQRLLRPCFSCLERASTRVPQGQQRANGVFHLGNSTSKSPHLSFRFSTAATQSTRTIPLDDLSNNNHNLLSNAQLQDRDTADQTSVAPTLSAALPSDGQEAPTSLFLDPTIIPPEQIKHYRALADTITSSSAPQEHQHLLAVYQSIASDPDLLRQLQPKDFMQAMNSCRDMYKVVPRMRQILTNFEQSRPKERRQIPELYDILLRTFVKLSDFKSAMNLIHEMRRKKGITIGTSTYHIILDICKHERNLEKAKRVLKEMRDNNVQVTSATYLLMLTVCGRAMNSRMAREYFDEMPLLGFDTDANHYNALINVYAASKNIEGTREVFEMMQEDGVPADQYTYAAMIKVLQAARRKNDAMELIQTMKDRGVAANVKILSAFDMPAIDILKECQSNNVEMKLIDFNVLIIRALRANQFADIPTIMNELRKQGYRPDVVTFTAMIDANIKMSKYEEAREIFRAMEQANIQPDVIAYSAMIGGALSQFSTQESIVILKDMIEAGLLPSRHTFNNLLSASVGEIGSDSLGVIRRTMKELGIKPDHRSFNAILSSYALEGDMESVRRTLEDMRVSKITPDALTYSILISGYLQHGDLRYAMEWYYKMAQSNLKPAVLVVNNLMSALHGSGQGQQALFLWKEMDRLQINKNERSYEIILDICEKYNLDEQRVRVEEELKVYLARVNHE
ncbi:hypothetical protein FBU30_010535 [Linnemannia zychae]|nr:hypothetical protein FBU30_010535 [Linnemannia zychae]